LLQKLSAEDIAAALVQAHRSKMPQPEELLADTPEARAKAKADRHRPGFEDVVWFKMGVGRRQKAEPRWLLPLICRRGHITRNEIGAIRVGQTESWFQIPRALASKFEETLQRTISSDDEQDAILIERSAEGPRIEARNNRKNSTPRVKANPLRKGKDGKPRAGAKRGSNTGGAASDEQASAQKPRRGKAKSTRSSSKRNAKAALSGNRRPKAPKRS